MRTGCHYSISLSVSVCVTYAVFTDCGSCTRPISQTREQWKRASVGERVGRVSSHSVSRWSRSPGCCGFRGVFWVRRDFVFFFSIFFLERTWPAASMRPACLVYLSTSVSVVERHLTLMTTACSKGARVWYAYPSIMTLLVETANRVEEREDEMSWLTNVLTVYVVTAND